MRPNERLIAAACYLAVTAGCSRALTEVADAGGFAIELTSASPMAAVAGEGCFEVRGSGLLTATRARVGGFEADIESLDSDESLRVCPGAETPRGGQTLEVGDAGMLAALPAQVSVVSSLTVWPVPPKVARGDSVTLTGTGFDAASPTNNLIVFGGDARATVTLAGNETLVVTVPDGALTGALTVALESVDPPSTAVHAGTPIVVRSFGIADVQPAQPYAGETIVVSLDVPLEEAAVGALEVTVDGSLVEWEIQDDTTLQVTLPSSLEEGEVTLCVRGDLAEPCTQPGDLAVLGPGHADLLRAPICPTLVASGSEVAYAYPAELSGTPALDHELVFLLDDELDAVYMLTLDPAAGQTAILPLPDGGTYSQLVAHIGCQTFENSACHAPGTIIPSLGYVAVVRERLAGRQSIVIVPLSDESNVIEVDLEANWAVERLVVVNAARLGVIVGKLDDSANSRVTVLDLRADPITSLPAGDDLGGILIDSAPIDRPASKAGEPNWVTHVVSVRPVSAPLGDTLWVHVDFGTQLGDSVAVAGPVQGSQVLRGTLQWIPGMDAVLVAGYGFGHVVAFAGAAPAWSAVRAETELVAEDPCAASCSGDAESTTSVFSAPTTYGGNPGHWVIHSTHTPAPVTAVAFVPLVSDAFWDGRAQVVLPVDDLNDTNGDSVVGNQVFDAPAGEWWLARPFDDFWPRVAIVRGAGALGRLTLPFGGAPASYEPILAGALSPDGGWAGTGGEWLAWNSLGYVARVDVRSAAVQTVVPPLVSAAEVARIPGTGLSALRVPHGTALDTRAELLLDDDGVPLGSFGIADRGEPLLLGDSLVTARATATTLEVTPYLGAGSNLHSELDNATVYDLQDPVGETCAPNDGVVYTRLLAPGGSVVAESCRGITQHACPSADPEDPTASPIGDPNRIYLWMPDLTSNDPSPAIETDLCGAGAEVLAVLPRPESDDLLVVWTIDYKRIDGADIVSVLRTMASIVQLAGGQYVNVSGDRLGSAGRVGWPIDLDSGAQQVAGWTYDSLNDRFLVALNQGTGGATVFGVWPNSLSVGAPFDLPAPLTAFAGSPDLKRFYLLVGTEVLVFANRAVTGIPKLVGRASLPSVGTSLGISENGETLIVGLDDGYCALGD